MGYIVMEATPATMSGLFQGETDTYGEKNED